MPTFWKKDTVWNKKPKSKTQTSPIDKDEKRAETYFSKYIRLRDCIATLRSNEVFKCCSCWKITLFKNWDAGHFISRMHKNTKFDERNCFGQCKTCNRYQQGNWDKMYEHIKKLYGQETIDELLEKSREIVRYQDYGMIADEYRNKYKILLKSCDKSI